MIDKVNTQVPAVPEVVLEAFVKPYASSATMVHIRVEGNRGELDYLVQKFQEHIRNYVNNGYFRADP